MQPTSRSCMRALLSDRWKPPNKLGKSVNEEAFQCSAWLGGRVRKLCIEGDRLPHDGETDSEAFLEVGFAVTRIDEPTHGWYVEYADHDGYPMLWFGRVNHPVLDEPTQRALELALFDLLTM